MKDRGGLVIAKSMTKRKVDKSLARTWLGNYLHTGPGLDKTHLISKEFQEICLQDSASFSDQVWKLRRPEAGQVHHQQPPSAYSLPVQEDCFNKKKVKERAKWLEKDGSKVNSKKGLHDEYLINHHTCSHRHKLVLFLFYHPSFLNSLQRVFILETPLTMKSHFSLIWFWTKVVLHQSVSNPVLRSLLPNKLSLSLIFVFSLLRYHVTHFGDWFALCEWLLH